MSNATASAAPTEVAGGDSPGVVRNGTPRLIGGLSATTIVAGSMLGVGIFLTPRIVAEQIHSGALYLVLWGLGGLVAFAGAVAYAELGTMIPRAGGDYVFLRRAYGHSTSFAGGWLLFGGVFVGSLATMSVAVCQYQLPVLLRSVTDFDFTAPYWLGPLEITGAQVAGIGLILALTGINSVGVRISAGAQTLVTLVPVAVLAVFAVYALATAPHDTAVAATSAQRAAPVGATAIAVAFLQIYFAYAGWNAVAYVGGEVRDPGRNIPVGLLAGTGIITLLYLLLCGAFLAVLGMGGLTTAFEAGTVSATAVIGARAELVVAGLIAIALLGSLNATVLAGARIAYAMAGDRALPSRLRRLSRHTRVPLRALWLQAALAAILIVSGTFEQLVELTSVAMFVLGGLTVAALFLLRWREPDAPRPYRATGYPVFPALYLLTSLGVIGVKIWQVVRESRQADAGSRVEIWFPLFGVGLFLVILCAHAGWSWARGRGERAPGSEDQGA